VPLVLPLARAYGLDPYHFAIIFLLNLEIAYLMPPLGINLFISSIRFGRPVTSLYRAVLMFIGVLFATLMVVSYVPIITTWLPSKVKGDDMSAPMSAPMGGPTGGENLDDKDFGLTGDDLDKLNADGGVDAGEADAAVPADAGAPDAGAPDAGAPDAGKHAKQHKSAKANAKAKAKPTKASKKKKEE
jgi:hypothetical protein